MLRGSRWGSSLPDTGWKRSVPTVGAQLASPGPAAAARFIEIEYSAGVAIEVLLRSGHAIRVRDGFDEDAPRRVVAVLDGASGAPS